VYGYYHHHAVLCAYFSDCLLTSKDNLLVKMRRKRGAEVIPNRVALRLASKVGELLLC
jgi:hypothetical protein